MIRRSALIGIVSLGCYSINVVPATNLPPQTDGETKATNEDTPLVLSAAELLSNDLDPEGDTTLTFALVAGSETNGTVTQNADVVTFTPTTDFTGVASFAYIVSDEAGEESAPTTVNINVNNTNDAPIADDPGPITTNEDTPTNIILRATDIDSADLAFNLITVPPLVNGTATLPNGVLRLVEDLQTSATVLYTPNPNTTAGDFFRFQVADADGFISDTITVNISITPQNDAPVAAKDGENDSIHVLRGGDSVDIPVLNNDTDLESNILTPEIIIPPLHGTAAVVGNNIRYTSDNITTGPVIFFYAAKDATLASTPAQVTVIVDKACGDGVVDTSDGEQCDDNNPLHSGCNNNCTFTCAGALSPTDTAVLNTSCYASFRSGGSSNFRADWPGAESFCSQNGGHLAIVNSIAENSLLRSDDLVDSSDLPWIGANDITTEAGSNGNAFLWADGSSVSTLGVNLFATGQPNNGNGNEDCAYMLDDGTWDDTDCANLAVNGVRQVTSMICEFPLP